MFRNTAARSLARVASASLRRTIATRVPENFELKPETSFTTDLGLDSLDVVEVILAVEEEFSIEIPDHEADSLKTIGQTVEYILQQPDAL
ncbi:hypothetical protein DV495_002929 [Geotrichum candidum]|nr:hypothetical protein DV452_001750 [Geotrichum candidum]KAF5128785.1 hypothetical protein DV495_002929 [Geotrichum candidum]KAF7498120.1 hypothetical protein DV113_003833 [Geotrichum candidum]KAI9213400.1 hypothetical protein DS838_001739 [Geotrichum bryndzae]